MRSRITLLALYAGLACAFMVNVATGESTPHRKETIAVLGTGDMGDSFGPRLASLGYRVIYGSRTPQSERVRALVERTGHGASALINRDAANSADIVLLAVASRAVESVVRGLGDLEDKTVIDITWPPVAVAADGYEEITIVMSAAERVQALLPKAHVVKAFGTTASNVIDDPNVAGGPVSVPIASDDRQAKEVVARIAAELGLDPIDAGPLRHARYIEGMMMLYVVPYFQERPTGWEFYFRRSNYWSCNQYTGGEYDDQDGPPPVDLGKLAEFPETQGEAMPCAE
jgi:predicted dinucleotide-binding enzyme